jgi:hypothetical protein
VEFYVLFEFDVVTIVLHPKGPFGAHDRIEKGYDKKLDKDRI